MGLPNKLFTSLQSRHIYFRKRSNPLYYRAMRLNDLQIIDYKSVFLFKKEKVIMLHSDKNALNDKDKLDLFEKYKLNKHMLSSVDLSSVSNMFPYLCKLFSREKEFLRYGPKFFICPLSCILEELDGMQLKNKEIMIEHHQLGMNSRS